MNVFCREEPLLDQIYSYKLSYVLSRDNSLQMIFHAKHTAPLHYSAYCMLVLPVLE